MSDSDLIFCQAVAMAKLIDSRVLANRVQAAQRTKKRQTLARLFMLWDENKRKKAAPRVWMFNRTSTFLEDSLKLPPDVFAKKFRFTQDTFFELVEAMRPQIVKQMVVRDPISVIKRVAIGLYTLKSGSDYSVVADVFGVSRSSVCRIMDEFLSAMISQFYNKKIRFPLSSVDQQQIANEFEYSYQFPNCIGALDGTHIPILTPAENGADYYNYKNWHSIILLGIVDSKLRFLYTNAGQPGKCNDGAAWGSSKIGKNTNFIREPFHLIADSAFPISSKLLKPYPIDGLAQLEANFNYRLSRARMAVECAFGRLKGRFRILLRRCDWELQKIVKCVLVCCILHNIAEENNEIFCDGWLKRVEEFDKSFPQPPQPTHSARSHNREREEGIRKRNEIANQLMELIPVTPI